MSKVEHYPEIFTADHRSVANARFRNMVQPEGGRFAEMTAEHSEEIIDLLLAWQSNLPASPEDIG